MNHVNTMWDRLADSGLIPAAQLESLKSQYECARQAATLSPTHSMQNWLVEQQLLTAYQAKIIAAGRTGPFQFGRYVIYEKTESGTMAGTFRASQRDSGHNVRLIFVPGTEQQDISRWRQISEQASKRVAVRHPFVVPLFESVASGQYRFLVVDDPPGKTLFDKLPPRGRVPWLPACQVGEQIAMGLAHIHSQGVTHGKLCTASIWVQSGGTGRVMWPFHLQPGLADHQRILNEKSTAEIGDDWMRGFQSPVISTGGAPTPRTDAFSFGVVLYRMLTGKLPVIDTMDPDRRHVQVAAALDACQKYELPDPLLQLLPLLLTADISNQLKDMPVAAKLIATIVGPQSLAKDHDPSPPSLRQLELMLAGSSKLAATSATSGTAEAAPRSSDGAETTPSQAIAAMEVPPQIAGSPAADRQALIQPLPRPNAGRRYGRRYGRRNGRRQSNKTHWLPLVIGGAVIVSAVGIGLLLSGMFAKPDSRGGGQAQAPSPGVGEQGPSSIVSNGDPDGATTGDPEGSPERRSLVQRVVQDDGQLLWESPTTGPPIDVTRIPASPDFIFLFRWNSLWNNNQARLFLKALGPEFEELQQQFRAIFDIPVERIENVLISLHADNNGRYQGYFQVQLREPITTAELSPKISDAVVESHPEVKQRMWQKNGTYFYFSPTDQSEPVRVLYLGSRELIEQSISTSGGSLIGGVFARLVARSDRSRDFTMIYRPAALITEEAGWLFRGKYAPLRRPLHLFFDDRVQGVLLSLHFGDANYLELALEQSVDLPAQELAEMLAGKLRDTRDDVINHVDRLPDHSFWSKIKLRLDNMVLELYRNTRVGVEHGKVLANCWLPEMAVHNLVAAAELTLASTQFSGDAVSPAASTQPISLDALLDRPRSLAVTSGPDLINLLNDIVSEVHEDYPDLPFEFAIKIQGNELLKHGITQNQRPGDVVVQNTPLRDILTQIMFQANPDKDASSPRDPRCKLVWVIAPDPINASRQLILVTTRQAATENNLALPQAFQPE